MGQHISGLTVLTSADPEIKYLQVSYNNYKNEYIKFFEAAIIHDDPMAKEISPPVCLTANMTIGHCAAFLTPLLRKKFVIVPGQPCYSLSFRPGSIIDIDHPPPYGTEDYIQMGHRCKFSNQDFLYTDSDLKRCCNKENSEFCPNIFNNNYETDHCDKIMSSICLQTPGTIPCRQWLAAKREIAFDTFMHVCSEHLETNYCSDFVDYTRPDHFGYSDAAILAYCSNHRSNPNCWCVAAPMNDRIFSLETVLGPKVCWLHECTDKSRDRKYLLFDQDIQRKNCKYIGCNINIETLRLINSNAELIANCGTSNTIDNDFTPVNYQSSISRFFSIIPIPIILMCFAVLFYFLKIYRGTLVNSKILNVYRN